jgi:MFS family permease
LWGIGFFTVDLIRSVLRKTFTAQGFTPEQVAGKAGFWAGVTLMMINVGAFFGMNVFGAVTQRIGRRPTFAIAFLAAMLSTAMVFWNLKDFSQIFWMVPIMGFCQLSLFAGYAIYFPELFPTNLRSTGTSFCYNVGRFVAAVGPAALGLLTSQVYVNHPEPMRPAGVTMCAIFLLGLFVLPFAPETKDQPLPEEQRGFSH